MQLNLWAYPFFFERGRGLVLDPQSLTEPVKNFGFAVADAVQQHHAYPPAAAAADSGEIEDRWLTQRRRRKAAILRWEAGVPLSATNSTVRQRGLRRRSDEEAVG